MDFQLIWFGIRIVLTSKDRDYDPGFTTSKCNKTSAAVQYNLVGSQTLAGIRIVVLVKSDHINKISNPEYSVVKTGQ